ncbi:MAG: hypothetical protein R3E88_19095 [Myxococcota bacterium]
MRPWMLAALGVALALAAIYALVTGVFTPSGRRANGGPSVATHDDPHEIDAASRAELRELLREADGSREEKP